LQVVFRVADDLTDEARLRLRVRGPVVAEAAGQFVLEASVLLGDLGVPPQVIAEEDVAVPPLRV